MTLALYAHPFSSYSQKVLIALYENATPFEMKLIGPETPRNLEALKKLWPLGKFPVLDDNGAVVFEATSIIEHLALHHPGPIRLIPEDPKIALDVRMMDRVFDNYVMIPMTWIVHDALRSPEARDAQTVMWGRSMLLERRSAWRTARRHPPFFMPIGRIRSLTNSANCGPIATGS
jgi:glutathione S-transferase